MAKDVAMQSLDAADEEQSMYAHGAVTGEELDEKYPNRPHNHSLTLPFHTLFTQLFNPLNEVRKKPTGAAVIARKKVGPHGASNLAPHEARRNTIERFISRWRKEVGDDFYPAFRLIIPEKDRDRAMYGLKEKTIGKLLVRVIGIDKNSTDAQGLMNWKSPLYASGSAGDFAARCGEVLGKRPVLTQYGDMRIGEVNVMLDQLSLASKEEEQYPLFEQFYRRMNAEELTWLVRIILRQMKVGATEKTFFELWHPDAENLFNVSSSLRRVCWELWDPSIRLEGDKYEITLMQCFQPQLAAFQMQSFQKMVDKMRGTEEDPVFWIEEKLDGERMQLHMVSDESVEGGKRFAFWSRKAKDYTYLYGNGFFDENSSLTRHLREAFRDSVRNIILDGEMITWDMEMDTVVGFGTLKTAALSEQRNPYSTTGHRPLYRVFDCLYLNDTPITRYTLRDRRRALEASINPIPRRLEIHEFTEATKAEEIEPMLRHVVAEASEGLVLKNPRSMYKLNERSDDWVKVKPEYMTEFGEALDCVVVGGYYGSGKRGGGISSFMCGLLVDQSQINQGAREQKTFSFFKVGGGFSAGDYQQMAHRTEGKWRTWDPKRPPIDWIELGGGERQYERPDVWIKPEDSVVISTKAASVAKTDQFRVGLTLRFPRFKKLKTDKTWREALTIQGFMKLQREAEEQRKEKEFQVDDERKKRRAPARKRKRPLVIVGEDEEVKFKRHEGSDTPIFAGLNFFIITDSTTPEKKSKAEIEDMVKAYGGSIVQSQNAKDDVVCVADREPIKVRSIKKEGKKSIVKPLWLFDCIKQSEIDDGRPSFLLPMEPRHYFHTLAADKELAEANIDEFGDSYCRDVTVDELRGIFNEMPEPTKRTKKTVLIDQLQDHGVDLEELPGYMFHKSVVYFDDGAADQSKATNGDTEQVDAEVFGHLPLRMTGHTVRFAGGKISETLDDSSITHVVSTGGKESLKAIRQQLAHRPKIPRVVTADWVNESWNEKTLLDEERFAP